MYANCTYKLVNETTTEERFAFLRTMMDCFNEAGYQKRFMLIGRKVTEMDVFSTRYIYSNYTFEGDWRDFLRDQMFAYPSPVWDELFSLEQLADYCNSILEFLEDEPIGKIFLCFKENFSGKSVIGDYLSANFEAYGKIEIPADEKECNEQQSKARSEKRKKETDEERQDATTETTKQEKAVVNLNLDLGSVFHTVLEKYVQDFPWWDALEKRFREEVEKLRPNVIEVKDRPQIKLEGRQHVKFQDALKLANLERQVFISGPMGTGKTTLTKQVADALQLPFAHISCTIGMSEAQLLGRMNATGDFMTTNFIRLYEGGGVFLFDEVDAADPNTMLTINSALANGYLSVPNRKDNPSAERHPDFICFCAANTWGFGSNDYAGRNILDAAFLDRFVGSKIYVDYDKQLETDIAGTYTQASAFIWGVRNNVQKSRIRRAVSTRALESCVRSLMHGDTMKEFAVRFFTGWTKEEREKALEGVSIPN